MAARILAAGFVAASLLAAPAFAQSGAAAPAATPSHASAKTTTTDTMTSDTDSAGKTVTKHHRVVKHHAKSSVKKTDADTGNTAQ